MFVKYKNKNQSNYQRLNYFIYQAAVFLSSVQAFKLLHTLNSNLNFNLKFNFNSFVIYIIFNILFL